MNTQKPDLRTAAQAVIDHWETPLWKDAPATAGYIAALRDALAAGCAIRAAQPAPQQEAQEPFQERVQPWLMACFGAEIASDRLERNHRFFEESTELVQANGMTRSEAHQLVDYTYDRPVGELRQEVGGVMVTLAALCLASGVDMHGAGEDELARIWTKVEAIRAKQAAKPKHSPLPQAAPASQGDALDAERWRMAALVGNEVMVHPDKRNHAAAVAAYMQAVSSGLDLTAAIDAARAAQEGK